MGWIDTPLTDEGKRNAATSAAKLKGTPIDQIISSDLGRAFTTAYLIARQIGYTAEIETRSGLREMNYGDLANQPYGVYPHMSHDENAEFIPPNGESLNQMQQRVLNCMREIGRTYESKTILVVVHDGTINALEASFLQHNMGAQDTTHHAHDFVAKLVWHDGRIISFDEIEGSRKSQAMAGL